MGEAFTYPGLLASADSMSSGDKGGDNNFAKEVMVAALGEY